MITTRNKLIFSLALVALLASVPFVAAQEGGIQYQHANNVVTVTTDTIGIRVTAFNQVPHFTIWDENDTTPGTDYHVTFINLFEANDTNGNGVYDPGVDHRYGDPFTLPTSDWTFSGFNQDYDGDVVTAVHFNFTNEDTFTPTPPVPYVLADVPSSMDLEIEIRVHINATFIDRMKFDLALDGWEWMYEDSILVFQFAVADSEHGVNEGTGAPADFAEDESGYKFTFGEAWMECANFAYAENSTHQSQVQVKASHGVGEQGSTGNAVYVAFEYFGNNSLDYDPTLGILSEEGPLIPPETLLIVGGAVVVLLVIAIVLKMRK
ncbi:MAG: hypothetical protein EAX95_01740 [Candidatus Thorarchaeota archaeon]|nr:hypothetical protein [Candidatus Thorarchaeota archaeon]